LGKEEHVIEVSASDKDMQYEIQAFVNIVQSREYPDVYRKYSLDALHVIDEARDRMGIVFPADKRRL
jgi:hypothetical protein